MNSSLFRLRPLPYQRLKPKERPLRGKAVTIGIGFLCQDGIVLCADNQITWPQSHKAYECKIYLHFTDEWWMVNTFAGDVDLVKSFNGKFEDAMTKISAPYTAAKIQDVIETVLSFLNVLDANPADLWMLCRYNNRGLLCCH